MDGRRDITLRRVTRTAIMLLVALLHVLAYWATSSASHVPMVPKETTFEWVFISPPRTAQPIRSDIGDVVTRSATTGLSPPPLTTALASPEDSAHDHSSGQPTTDWNSELELVAKSIASGNGSAQQRDFGFQHRAAPPKAPTFDWDRVHTHRIEIAPEGGMIIHLSDKCVMVLMPLPFAFCGIGKKEANGHLLDHMNDGPVAEVPAP